MRRIILYGAFFLTIPFISNAQVIISEIAWMGTANSANDEWIELLNISNADIDLTGWVLEASDGSPQIILDGLTISGDGFLILERTDDESLPGVIADYIYTGALSNGGEYLSLKNNGEVIDSINATEGWPAGDNTTKDTMQRNNSVWTTAPATPKENGNVSNQESGVDVEEIIQEENKTISTEKTYSDPVEYPTIHVFAGDDRVGIAGGELIFEGRALGYKDAPLDQNSVRYVWGFGDGGRAEGVKVKHAYHFPGEYIVTVTGSHNDYLGAVSDQLLVKINKNPIVISDVISGVEGRIELHNPSNEIIELSDWILENKNAFRIPLNTFIGANAKASYTSEITGIAIEDPLQTLLKYPNGKLAYRYEPKEDVLQKDVEQEKVTLVVTPTIDVVEPKEAESVVVEIEAPEIEIEKENNKEMVQEASLINTASNSWENNTDYLWFAGSIAGGLFLGFSLLLFRRKMGLWSSS